MSWWGRTATQVVDSCGSDALELLVAQLWCVPIADGRARVVVNPPPDPEWVDAEIYWSAPSARDPRLLIPAGPPTVTAGSLTNYRRMRRRPISTVRSIAGAVSRTGAPVARDRLVVQTRDKVAADELPLSRVAAALDEPRLHASIGLRTGAGRKATMQLVDTYGIPRGYAKLAWSPATRQAVSNETQVLRDLDGGAALLRTPSLLASGELGGQPYLVSEPLPLSCRSLRGSGSMPTPAEFAALCPVHRWDTVPQTGQFIALAKRVGEIVCEQIVGSELAEAMTALTASLESEETAVPVTQRWHGDFAHWNVARDATGQLWCWDWESSEEDATGGMDALHWSICRQRGRGRTIDSGSLQMAIDKCELHMWATGYPRRHWPLAAAVYALTTAERSCALARDGGGWPNVWTTQAQMSSFLASAHRMLNSASD